jgi:mannose-6-phosphate isomerase-like protein (cupin superfamily)
MTDATDPTGPTPGAAHEVDRRPWGRYEVLEDAPAWKVKRLTVDPGQRLSYQRHEHRAEHWVVVAGSARVTLDGTDHDLAPGQSIDIPQRGAHRLANPGADRLELIEVQLGDYFGEDDIERLSDDYGR